MSYNHTWGLIKTFAAVVMLGAIASCQSSTQTTAPPELAATPDGEAVPTIPTSESALPEQKSVPVQSAQAPDLYTVAYISDGDTLEVTEDGETVRVRLACIDAPESDQLPHGPTSTDKLSSLVGGQVRLNVVDIDRYGRSVAEVYTPDGRYVNQEMIAAGQAVVYDQYLDSCGPNGPQLLAAEQQAQAANRGVWADESFVMPWDYRQGERAAAPEPVPTAQPQPTSTTNLPACASGDCDCGDFSSWEQAQALLESTTGDPHRLDGDSDGIACESLR